MSVARARIPISACLCAWLAVSSGSLSSAASAQRSASRSVRLPSVEAPAGKPTTQAYYVPPEPSASAVATDQAVPDLVLPADEVFAADQSPFSVEPRPNGQRSGGRCGPTGCSPCGPANPCGQGCGADYCGATYGDCRGAFWLRADYLVWWTNGSRLPLLVTGSRSGQSRGVPGNDDTYTAFGDERVNGRAGSGVRFTVGYWVDSCETLAIVGDFFDLQQQSAGFHDGSDGQPVFARPYRNSTDPASPVWASQLVAYPGLREGDITVRAWEYFQGAGALLRRNLLVYECGCGDPRCDNHHSARIDLIAGYRFYRLTDALSIDENLTYMGTGGPIETHRIGESFRATNEFNGAELGLVTEIHRGRWSLELLAKMALGANHRTLSIRGFDNDIHLGGLLALETNIGRHVDDDFVVIPQFGAEIGYQVCCGLRAFFGYNFLYWADVARAGDQVDLSVDPRNIPPVRPGGGSDPGVSFRHTEFWAQGLNLGLELRF